MKQFLTTLTMLLLIKVAYSQARLGSSATEIKNEFWETKHNLKSGYTDDGIYYISIWTERATVFYYFNEDKVCILCMIIPDNQGALNFYVELYNKQYVIVSSTEWKMYSNGGIAEISLIFPDDGGYYFLWK